jgi:hypothetical protein
VNRSIKTVSQLEQVFEQYHRMFQEVEEKKKPFQLQCFCKEETPPPLKILQYCFGKGGRSIIRGFSLSAGGLET